METFCLFLSDSVCFCPCLSVSICFCPFCPFFFCLFLSVTACFFLRFCCYFNSFLSFSFCFCQVLLLVYVSVCFYLFISLSIHFLASSLDSVHFHLFPPVFFLSVFVLFCPFFFWFLLNLTCLNLPTLGDTFCPFLFVSVCFCLFLSYISVSVCFFPCHPFLSVSVSICLFLSVSVWNPILFIIYIEIYLLWIAFSAIYFSKSKDKEVNTKWHLSSGPYNFFYLVYYFLTISFFLYLYTLKNAGRGFMDGYLCLFYRICSFFVWPVCHHWIQCLYALNMKEEEQIYSKVGKCCASPWILVNEKLFKIINKNLGPI